MKNPLSGKNQTKMSKENDRLRHKLGLKDLTNPLKGKNNPLSKIGRK